MYVVYSLCYNTTFYLRSTIQIPGPRHFFSFFLFLLKFSFFSLTQVLQVYDINDRNAMNVDEWKEEIRRRGEGGDGEK